MTHLERMSIGAEGIIKEQLLRGGSRMRFTTGRHSRSFWSDGNVQKLDRGDRGPTLEIYQKSIEEKRRHSLKRKGKQRCKFNLLSQKHQDDHWLAGLSGSSCHLPPVQPLQRPANAAVF